MITVRIDRRFLNQKIFLRNVEAPFFKNFVHFVLVFVESSLINYFYS